MSGHGVMLIFEEFRCSSLRESLGSKQLS